MLLCSTVNIKVWGSNPKLDLNYYHHHHHHYWTIFFSIFQSLSCSILFCLYPQFYELCYFFTFLHSSFTHPLQFYNSSPLFLHFFQLPLQFYNSFHFSSFFPYLSPILQTLISLLQSYIHTLLPPQFYNSSQSFLSNINFKKCNLWKKFKFWRKWRRTEVL